MNDINYIEETPSERGIDVTIIGGVLLQSEIIRRDPFQRSVPCWQFKRYHLFKAHGRTYICTTISTETLIKLAFPYSNIEHAEMDADVFIISPKGN